MNEDGSSASCSGAAAPADGDRRRSRLLRRLGIDAVPGTPVPPAALQAADTEGGLNPVLSRRARGAGRYRLSGGLAGSVASGGEAGPDPTAPPGARETGVYSVVGAAGAEKNAFTQNDAAGARCSHGGGDGGGRDAAAVGNSGANKNESDKPVGAASRAPAAAAWGGAAWGGAAGAAPGGAGKTAEPSGADDAPTSLTAAPPEVTAIAETSFDGNSFAKSSSINRSFTKNGIGEKTFLERDESGNGDLEGRSGSLAARRRGPGPGAAVPDFRLAYLQRLSYAAVWVPREARAPKHQTLTIFDWDDTLLCTSYCALRGRRAAVAAPPAPAAAASAASAAAFADIERAATGLLQAALRLSARVVVLTNAVEGWVQHSAARFVPGLVPVLRDVDVVSARAMYEKEHPGKPHLWKTLALGTLQAEMRTDLVTNLISIGDSTIEADAVQAMGRGFERALVKTVKFQEYPSPAELARQLQLLLGKFDRICCCAKNLSVKLEKRAVRPKNSIESAGCRLGDPPGVVCGGATSANAGNGRFARRRSGGARGGTERKRTSRLSTADPAIKVVP